MPRYVWEAGRRSPCVDPPGASQVTWTQAGHSPRWGRCRARLRVAGLVGNAPERSWALEGPTDDTSWSCLLHIRLQTLPSGLVFEGMNVGPFSWRRRHLLAAVLLI